MSNDCNKCVKVDCNGNEIILQEHVSGSTKCSTVTHGTCQSCHYNPCQCQYPNPEKCTTSVKPKSCSTVQHLQPIIEKSFSPVLRSSGKAIMPQIGHTNALSFLDSEKIPEGAILYHADIGYIEIVSFDETNRLATFRNSIEFVGLQVLQPGEYIPQCVDWIAGIPAYGGASSNIDNGCYLALDFIVPPLNGTAYASFTSTDCFQVGDSIRIDGTVLKVTEITSSTQALLSNVESSSDAGKEITAKNNCSEFLHKVSVIGESNPCDNPVSALTSLIGATSNETCEKGILVPISENQYIGSDGSNRWIAKDFPIQDVQTTFDGCLVLNPSADPQEYPLTLDSVEGFGLYDIVEFSCDSANPARQFSIKAIDGNVITLIPHLFTVNAVENIAADCNGCTLKQVSSCHCSVAFSPESKTGGYDKCHQHNADPNQSPIDVTFAIDQRVGFYTHEVNTDNSGNNPNIQYTNNNPYPVTVEVTANIDGFHRNLIVGASEVNTEFVSRYAFNIQDEDTNQVIGSTNFSIESSGNQMGGATFDTGEGNWMQASTNIFQTGTGVIKARKVLQSGESIDWKFKELFAYRANVLPVAIKVLEDNMCYQMRWFLIAQHTRVLP